MRKIPSHISDPKLCEKLALIDRQIDEKMARVNALRAVMKKKELSPAELQELKELGSVIDQLDQEWKSLTG